jgi:hypothetical protein
LVPARLLNLARYLKVRPELASRLSSEASEGIIRLGCKDLLRTNTPAYSVSFSVTKEKV